MEIKTVIGVKEQSLYFNSNANKEISPAYETRDNWGFNYTTLYNGDEPITDKSKYKENTIFLDSDLDILYGKSSLSNVFINTKGPALIGDYCSRDTTSLPFKMKFVFESEVPMDIMQMSISLIDPTSKSNYKDLYYISRQNSEVKMLKCISDLHLNKNDKKYELTFKLYVNDNIDRELTIDELNNHLICLTVWDISGNGLEYYADGPWNLIDINIFNIERLQISFRNITPQNKLLSNNIEGECTCTVYNPNKDLWSIRPTIKLNHDSIGRIQGASFDNSKYATEGLVSFKITNIKEKGNVIVDAWLDIDNPEQKEIVFNKTKVSGTCGPWLLIDTEGRQIKMMPYVPKYLKDEKYNDFVQYTEFFLNSMYESMSTEKNIGILEKVARIGDFNYIDRIEKPLVKHYKEEFGIEIEPNLDEIQKFLMQKRISRSENGEIVAQEFAYGDFTDDELYDFMRYVYREIPEYNQYKGSYKGMKMALNVLGMCVKIIELWAKTNDAHIDDMIRADDLNDYPLNMNKSDKAIIAKYYLTSRFDVDMEETNISFIDFNELADNIVRLIFQVKPVTRLLRKLSYIYYTWIDIHFSYLWYPEYNEQQLHHYTYTWDLSEEDCFKKHIYSTIAGKFGNNDVLDNIANIDKLYVPFLATNGLCSWISRMDHEWENTSEESDEPIVTTCQERLVRTKYTRNSYLTLFNIAHKIRVSDMDKLKFKINYKYTHTYYEETETQIPGGTIKVPTKQTEEIESVIDRSIELWDFTDGEIPENENTVWIEEAENGFYIVFQGTTHAVFSKLGLNEKLIKEGKLKYGNPTDPLNYHEYTLDNFDITMSFDCALGTDYIGQGICKTEDPEIDLYLATLGDTDSYRKLNLEGYPHEEPEILKKARGLI